MSSAASLITAQGGPAVFAEIIGRTPGQVRVWKHRNRIPREAWPEIVQHTAVTLDELRETERAPGAAPPAAEARP